MRYWLMKTEPDECSIDDALAAPRRITPWTGVRNYQARNFMREQMRIGDGVLFYHSSCEEPGIAGLAQVASAAYPDPTQFERSSPYYDPKAKKDDPGEEFGKDIYQIVLEKVAEYNYPVCFDFPVGHQKNNVALKCGVMHHLAVHLNECRLSELR